MSFVCSATTSLFVFSSHLYYVFLSLKAEDRLVEAVAECESKAEAKLAEVAAASGEALQQSQVNERKERYT